MKNTFALILFFLFQNAFAQLPANDAKPYIELTGTSEMEIAPDEIYISIVLLERPENKEKLTIDKQEKDLKGEIKDLGIDFSNLTLSDASADYQKLRRKQKDVIVSKTYVLKVVSAEMLSKVYERLDKINVTDAYISRVHNSKMEQFKKENRIKAIKIAKEKVEYILAAINLTGKPLQITEVENNYQPYYNQGMMRATANTYSGKAMEDTGVEQEIGFKKIKITSSYFVRYQIIYP